jgi:hypothetical protein
MKSSNMRAESTRQNGRDKEPDFVVELLQKAGLPVTRENYIGLAYPDGLPEDFDESELPV